MRKWLGLSRVGLLALMAGALLFAGCGQTGSSGGSSSSAPTKGKVVLVVVDNATGQSVGGYNVTFNPSISDPSAVDPGDYTVTVEKSGYFKAQAAFKVIAGSTTTVTVNLVPIPPPPDSGGQVAVLVIDEAGSPIAGATVSDGSQSATTDAQGRADLSYGSDGTYAISVNASGYFGAAQLAQVEMGKTVALTFVLKEVPPPAPTTGTLAVFVYDASTNQGLAGATVSSGSLSFTASGALYTASDVPAGTHAVQVSKDGYKPAERAAVVKAGEITVINVGLEPIPPAPQKIGSIEVLSVQDQWGVELPSRVEDNPVKDVKLYASQTEEPVCVTVKVLDPNGDPVPNARVRVSADTTYGDGYGTGLTRLFAGCTSTSEALDFVKTDAQGIAKFSFYNTGDDNDAYGAPWPVNGGYPTKFVVSATDALDQTAQQTEFKVFFWNVSHLYYSSDGDTWTYTKKRTGADLGTIVNAFNFDDNTLNAHRIYTGLRRRQPTSDISTHIGKVVYRMSGPDADKVEFISGCESLSGGVCTDIDGSGVVIRPKATVTAADLPLEVKIDATWYASVTYGHIPYEFALKSYSFTKRWVGANLQIEKSGPHIVTWTGSDLKPGDVTLAAQGGGAKKTYTYTITVTNTGAVAAHNVVINDNLPAELGFDSASAGGTYDPVLHKVTWDYTTLPDLVSIAPGNSVTVSVTVYPRHKPGYAWDDNNQDGTSDGGAYTPYDTSSYKDPAYVGHFYKDRPPKYAADTEYDDPYNILNEADARGENTPFVRTSWELWVVRPFMEVQKTVPAGPWYVGDPIPFNITVTNVDRAEAPISDAGYQYLKSTFPDEYAQEMQLFEVTLRDLFSEGLDFINATPSGSLDADTKTYTWQPVAETLNVGQSASARIWLRAAVDGEWQNCVRAYADNLNQPNKTFINWSVPPTQYEPATGTDPRPDPPYTPETDNPDDTGNYLESCVRVTVQPRTTTTTLYLTTLGEYSTPDDGTGNEVDTPGNPVHVGDTYWYIARAGVGGTAQTNFQFQATFSDPAKAAPTGTTPGTDVVLYTSTDGITWTPAPATSYTVSYAAPTLTVNYTPTVPADTYIRISFRVQASNSGSVSVDETVSTTEYGSYGPVSESTNIQP